MPTWKTRCRRVMKDYWKYFQCSRFSCPRHSVFSNFEVAVITHQQKHQRKGGIVGFSSWLQKVQYTTIVLHVSDPIVKQSIMVAEACGRGTFPWQTASRRRGEHGEVPGEVEAQGQTQGDLLPPCRPHFLLPFPYANIMNLSRGESIG